MIRATPNLTKILRDMTNRRSLVALLGTAVIAAATLGVTTGPAAARPTRPAAQHVSS
jgi:hypothetical protein